MMDLSARNSHSDRILCPIFYLRLGTFNLKLYLQCRGICFLWANLLNFDVEQPTGIFGVPLHVSIKYANVAISLTDDRGESFIYGYVPIVVAKCGVFLKEKGTRFLSDT